MLSEDETWYVKPYYLKMMGLNAIWDEKGPPIREVAQVAQSLSHETVIALLRGEWRQRVMGAWFSLAHDVAVIGPDLARSMETSRGSLSAPPLAVSAATVLGKEAVPSLLSYATSDVGAHDSSNRFVAAVLLTLGQACPGVSVHVEDREAAGRMLAVARVMSSRDVDG